MYKKIYKFIAELGQSLKFNGTCNDCNCGSFKGNYPSEPYCECGHHYDRHAY